MADVYLKLPVVGGSSGTVTEVDTGTGLSGGPITTTGTVALDVPVTIAHGGTNSVAALANGKVMKSAGGAIVESGVTVDASNNVGGVGTVGTSGAVTVSVGNNVPAFNINNSGPTFMIQCFAGIRLEFVTSGAFFQFAENGDGNATLLSRLNKNLLLAADGSNAAVGVIVRGSSGQTAKLLDVQLDTGVSVLTVAPSGDTVVATTTGAFTPPKMTTTERDALTAVKGMMIYNTTTDKHQGYNGSWVDFY